MTSNLNRLEQFFSARGYTTPDIALLQPAEPFLDTAGEDMRARIFMTTDRVGRSLCLRPEFTIPVCLTHFKSGEAEGRYAYGGKVFRQGRDGVEEFSQAGVETIGGTQNIENDVECITTAIDALSHCGVNAMSVVIGDQEIFEALLDALDLPTPWRARLARAFGDGDKLESDLQLITDGSSELENIEPELRALLDKSDAQGVEAWINGKMNAANLPAKAGRTAHDIAARMMAKAELAATQLSQTQCEILRDFLNIEVNMKDAPSKLTGFAKAANLNLDEAISKFDERAQKLIAAGGDSVEINWRAGFGRRLDYYTGIVFEISEKGANKPLCGGGRYDRLMNMLGALKPTPAIGFSIWLDRLGGDKQ